MKHLNISALLASLVLLSSASCTKVISSFADANCEAKGPVVTRTRPMQQISAISTSSGINVTYTQSDTLSLTVEAPSDIIDFVTTEIDGSQLSVGTTRALNNCASLVKVRVSAPMVTDFNASSGGALNVPSGLNASGRSVATNTSSGASISISAINAASLSATTSSGSDTDIDGINAASVSAGASSGSSISLSGNAETVSYQTSSGASLAANGLKAISGSATASSGGSITSNVSGSFSSKESSGGSISNK